MSVDEIALVIGANELGFRVTKRDRSLLTLDLPWERNVTYDILDVMDFSSDRKRMSVICRMPNGTLNVCRQHSMCSYPCDFT